MNIHAGDYVMLKSVDEVKHFYKEWKSVFTSKETFIDTGDRYFSHTMLNAMDASNVYRVAWLDNDKVFVFVDNNVYAFDEKCIKDVYRLTKVN